MPLVVSIILVISVTWYILSKLYADKLGEAADKEYESICEGKDKK